MNCEEAKKYALRILADTAITVGIVFLLFRVLFNIVVVDGVSMLPTFRDGSVILTQCHFYEPQRGDIVVCDCDWYGGYIVKRIIAVEGDTIDIDFDTGDVTVNGEVIQEPYINEKTHENMGVEFPLVVGDGRVFVMGDNRNSSLDSRHPNVGTIERDDIKGKYLLSIIP